MKLYEKSVNQPGLKRQKHWDKLAEERSKQLWTVHCRIKKLSKKIKGQKGEKLQKMQEELDELNEQLQSFEELKLDTMIVCNQHQKYMEHE